MAADALRRPKAPDGLEPAGRKLWRSLTGVYEFDAHEAVILALAAAQADEVARLEAVVADEGASVAGSKGQLRVHGALTELRLGRLALAKLLDSLGLPASDEAGGDERPKSQQQRAAEARWRRVRGAEERRRQRIAEESA